MKKINKTPIAAAVGTAIVSTFSATTATAEANPFGMTELSEGYMQLAENDKAGEMKCGESMGMKEGTCGEGKCAGMMGDVKVKEGKCAGNKPKAAAAAKSEEGKCGEGKCAGMMEGDKMKKGMEGQCGEMMKGKEGSCGMEKDKADQKKSGGWPIKGTK